MPSRRYLLRTHYATSLNSCQQTCEFVCWQTRLCSSRVLVNVNLPLGIGPLSSWTLDAASHSDGYPQVANAIRHPHARCEPICASVATRLFAKHNPRRLTSTIAINNSRFWKNNKPFSEISKEPQCGLMRMQLKRIDVAMGLEQGLKRHSSVFAGIHNYARERPEWRLIVDE